MNVRLTLAAAALAAGLTGTAQSDVQLELVGRYETGFFDESAAEITAYDAGSRRLFLVNALAGEIEILDFADPANPVFLSSIALPGFPNSVSAFDGLVAIALEDSVKQNPGTIVFTDVDGNVLNTVAAGALPDMVTFSPDGRYVVAANEGEPNDDYTVDPEGSVTIVDLAGGVGAPVVTQVGFGALTLADLDASTRVFGPGASVAQDLEPEYVAISDDSRFAFVACQENNAMIVVRLEDGRLVDLWGLGFKDHSLPGQGLDASDRDDTIHIANWPVFGVPMPDAIAFARGADGLPYVMTANEGDARDYAGFSEEERIKDLILDTLAFPDADFLQENEQIGRLNVTTTLGDTDQDGEYEELYAYGTRSFSVYDAYGTLVWDSGEDFERITAEAYPDDFNSGNDENGDFEGRSDNKGPEPEAITVGQFNGRQYAFVGLERIGGVMVYDVTDPTAPVFKQYVNNRDFSGDPAAGTAGDLGPEGIVYISPENSPSGEALVVVAHEISGSVAVYAFRATCPAPAGLDVAFGAPGEATLDWEPVNSAFGYRLRIAEAGSTGSKVLASGTDAKAIAGLTPGQTYVWSVRAACADDTSAYALRDTFTVPTARMMAELQTLQVVPNPVSEFLTLRGLADASAVGTLYAIDGRLVAGPVNGARLQEGWNLSALPAGAYRLRVESATGSRTLAVIKR